MLVKPEDFFIESKKIGCSSAEYFQCMDNITNRMGIINHLKRYNQDLYFTIDYNNCILSVITNSKENIEKSNRTFSELFATIKYLSH